MAIAISKSNYETEVTKSATPVLLDFYADWCTPCKMLSPVIDEISNEVTGAKVGKINIDEEPELTSQFNIMSIPTLVIVKDGKMSQKIVGVQPKERILSILESL